MKSLIIVGIFIFGFGFMNSVYAEEAEAAPEAPKKEEKAKKPKKPKKPAPVLVEMTLVGKITVTEKKNKKDPTKVTKKFAFTDEAGNKINLPRTKKAKKPKKLKEGEIPAPAPAMINLEEYADAKVAITFKGFTKEKKGKQVPVIKQILKIEKVAE